MRSFHALVFVCFALVASPAAADDVRAAIEADNALFSAQVAANDAAALAAHYTEDGAVIAPGAPVVRGRAAIQAFWAGALATTRTAELKTLSVESAGDLAMEEGEVTLTSDTGAVSKGRYLVVWKRVNGAWKLHRDIWN